MMKQHFEIVYEMISGIFVPQKEKQLTFDEIGFSITIPKGLRVFNDQQIKKKEKKSADSINVFYIQQSFNKECVPLFYAKNAERSSMSGVMFPLKDKSKFDALQDYNEYIESFWKSIDKDNTMYARAYIEKTATKLSIGSVTFDRDEISWRIPERKISSFYSYHGFFKGYQIAISAIFSNQEFGAKILKSIESARFI